MQRVWRHGGWNANGLVMVSFLSNQESCRKGTLPTTGALQHNSHPPGFIFAELVVIKSLAISPGDISQKNDRRHYGVVSAKLTNVTLQAA